MKRAIYLGALAIVFGGLAVAVLGGAQVHPVRLDDGQSLPELGGPPPPPSLVLAEGGIQFPDGTVQTTAGPYLGEFCWEFVDDPGGDSSYVKLGLTHFGDGHVSVNGLGFDEGGDEPVPVTGTYEVLGDDRYMTLTTTVFDGVPPSGGEFAATISQVHIAQATGNGTFQAITILYSLDGGAFEPMGFEQGTALLLPSCIIP